MTKSVLFILSTNYAGSHYLSLLVGSHSKAAHIGEIHRFRDERIRKEPCYRCGDYRRCPVFRGVEPGRIQNVHEIVFGNVGPGINVLVDNSKKTEWAQHFLETEKFVKRFVHLVRDPRALVRRWDLNYDLPKKRWRQRWKLARRWPAKALSILRASPRMLYVYKWLDQNRTITSYLRQNRLEYMLTTYRDLATNTTGELNKLMGWLGLEFQPTQIEYWNFEHHGTEKPEYQWIKEKKRSYFDTRWSSYLSAQEQHEIAHHPLVQEYLKQIGLGIDDEGLRRM
jgi:hypothetical protein